MVNRYLIVSDLHLCDLEDEGGGWKAYKHSRWAIDSDFANLVAHFTQTCRTDEAPVLVLNGDVLDFDVITAVPAAPSFHVSRTEIRHGLKPTEDKSVWKLRRILGFHSEFLRALALFIGGGGRILYLLGNHDREMHFPIAQEEFRATLAEAAALNGVEWHEKALEFIPWFYYVPGEIFIEHGNQYDYYASFSYVLSPVVHFMGEDHLALPMGNLSGRYMVNHMGYFNPHAGDYILNGVRYFLHWWKYYAFSRRSLVVKWFLGSLLTLGRVLKLKKHQLRPPSGHDEMVREYGRRSRLTQVQIDGLVRLQEVPIANRLYRMLHEFWIDRLIMASLMTAATAAVLLVPFPLWAKVMIPLVAFPLIFLVYELAARDDSVHGVHRRMPACARSIARLLDVPVVVFGHTHVPRLVPLEERRTFVDTGTWAPIFSRMGPERLTPGFRNYAVVSARDGEVRADLDCWDDGSRHAFIRSSASPRKAL